MLIHLLEKGSLRGMSVVPVTGECFCRWQVVRERDGWRPLSAILKFTNKMSVREERPEKCGDSVGDCIVVNFGRTFFGPTEVVNGNYPIHSFGELACLDRAEIILPRVV